MSKLHGAQKKVLATIMDLQTSKLRRGDSAATVCDVEISASTTLALSDVRDWCDTLEGEGYIDLFRAEDGLNANITAKGRLYLGLLKSLESSPAGISSERLNEPVLPESIDNRLASNGPSVINRDTPLGRVNSIPDKLLPNPSVFIYKSNTKIKMLGQQLGISVAGLDNEYSALAKILICLDNNNALGDIQSNKPFVYGQCKLRWGVLKGEKGMAPVALFYGLNTSPMILLGGSPKHIVGQTVTRTVSSEEELVLDTGLPSQAPLLLGTLVALSHLRISDPELNLKGEEITMGLCPGISDPVSTSKYLSFFSLPATEMDMDLGGKKLHRSSSPVLFEQELRFVAIKHDTVPRPSEDSVRHFLAQYRGNCFPRLQFFKSLFLKPLFIKYYKTYHENLIIGSPLFVSSV